MSRIGKKEIKIEKAKLDVKKDKIIVSGPKGEVEVPLFPGLVVEEEDGVVRIDNKRGDHMNSKWGLVTSLLENAVKGVEEGYEKRLIMKGVGYRAEKRGNDLVLHVGYSNPVDFEAPEDIELDTEENTKIIVKGCDKQVVGQVAANIRSIRKPEPYKGKGIRYENERIRRKVGKAATVSE